LQLDNPTHNRDFRILTVMWCIGSIGYQLGRFSKKKSETKTSSLTQMYW